MRKIFALVFSFYLFSFIAPFNHLFCLNRTSSSDGEHQGNSHSNAGHPQHPMNPCKDKAPGPPGHSCCNLISQGTSFYFSPSGFSLFVSVEIFSCPSEIPQSIFRPPELQA